MYAPTVISSITEAATKSTRTFHNRLVLYEGNNIVAYLSEMKSCNVTQNFIGDEKLSMGSCVSAELTATFIANNEDNITTVDDLNARTTTPLSPTYNYKGKKIVAQCGILRTESRFRYIPQGTFYIDEATTVDNGVTIAIKAYDIIGTKNAQTKFTTTDINNLSTPVSAKSVISTIASKLGLNVIYNQYGNTYPDRTLTDIEIANLVGMTYRDILANMAGLLGCNIKITNTGYMLCGWFNVGSVIDTGSPAYYTGTPSYYGIEIPATLQYQHGLKKLQDSVFYVASCTSSNNTDKTTYPDESITFTSSGATASTGITFANKFIQPDDIKNIAGASGATTDYGWMSSSRTYQPCEIEWRGHPCIEAGDVITAYDKDNNSYLVFIAKQVINLCGGLKSVITCPIGDAEISFSSGEYVTQAELSRTQTTLQSEILSKTAEIVGASGGYVTLLDLDTTSPGPDNLFITDVRVDESDFVYDSVSGGYVLKTGTGATKVIRMNSGGIGISSHASDAGTANNPFNVAITGSGIVGTYITAGSITTGQLNFSPITTTNLQTNVDGLTIQGSTITNIADINGYQTLMNTVDSKATVAQATAAGTTAAQAQIASFTADHNLTYIGSDGIYTGTITAQQINVGWQGGNYCSCKWSGDTSPLSFEADDNNYPKILVTENLSNEKTIYSAPFYAAKGAKITISCYALVKGTNSSTQYIGGRLQYCATATGTFNNVGTEYWTTSGESLDTRLSKSITYEATNGGYYRFMLWFNKCNENSYVDTLVGTYTVTGNMVVTGKIQSVDTNTYFDLDESEIVTNSSIYKTRLSGGVIEIYSNSSLRGLITTPSWRDSGETSSHYAAGLYYQQGNATCSTLGMRTSDGSTFYPALQAFYNGGNSYARVYANFGGYETVDTSGYKGKFGIGNATYSGTSYKSASLQVVDSTDTIFARLDCIGIGTNVGAIRCQSGSSQTPWLVLGSGSLIYNSKTLLDTSSSISASKISGTISADNLPSSVITTSSDGSNLWIGGYKMASGANFSDFMEDRVSHIKITIGNTTYTAYWS